MNLTKNKNLAPVIAKVFYAYTYNVGEIGNGVDDNHKVVLFKNGTDWTEVYKVPRDADFEEVVKKSDAGKLYDQKLPISFPGDDDTNVSDFEELEDRPLLIMFQYDNGKRRFFGSLDNPVEALISYSTNKGGAVITFSCTSKFRAFWI